MCNHKRANGAICNIHCVVFPMNITVITILSLFNIYIYIYIVRVWVYIWYAYVKCNTRFSKTFLFIYIYIYVLFSIQNTYSYLCTIFLDTLSTNHKNFYLWLVQNIVCKETSSLPTLYCCFKIMMLLSFLIVKPV